MRKNPLMWDDEAPQGVLSPNEGAESGLSILGMPSSDRVMRVRDADAEVQGGPAVREMLDRIADALDDAAKAGRGWRKRIEALSKTDRQALLDALGEGEVSVFISAGTKEEGDVQIQETVLPGVWVGRAMDINGDIAAEWIEVTDAPHALREAAELRPRDDIPLDMLQPPQGAMNVMGVLSEAREKARTWTPNTPSHVINFTLFPMTETDSAFLAKVLGEVGVRISSGGYGAARIIMTAFKRVWAVQYLNAMGAVILDTLEIGDIPGAALAAKEDFEDSAERIRKIAGAYVT